jgi:type I restriction enzyme S subunit
MAGKYQAYPEHKDSGVDILNNIPSHWNVMQLKRSVNGCVNGIWGGEPEGDENNTIVLRVADFDRSRLLIKDEGYTYRKIELKEKAKRSLKRGDLLLEKSGGGEKTLVGQVVLFDKSFEAVTSNFIAKMTPNDGFDSRYLNYVFSRFYEEKINFCSIKQNTGIQNLDSESYLTEKFGFPTHFEQVVIANFLDYETAKIDALIEKQQQLIQLLKEKRQAVISHVVTKGLKPDAPMRDSGVEWLGKVPEHWVSCSLRRYTTFIDGDRGAAYPNENDLRNDGVVFLSSKNIIGGLIDLAEVNFISHEKFMQLNRGKALDGDLIVKVRGSAGRIGELAKFEAHEIGYDTAFINAQMMIIRTSEGLLSDYLRLVSQSLYWTEQLYVGAYGTAQQQLSNEVFSNLYIVVPPLKEQALIVETLEQNVSAINELVNKAQKAISLMQERRTALISAAVTGKIDVRGWQISGSFDDNQEINREDAA